MIVAKIRNDNLACRAKNLFSKCLIFILIEREGMIVMGDERKRKKEK